MIFEPRKKDKKFIVEITRVQNLEGKFLWNYAITKNEDITDLQRINFYKKVTGISNISDFKDLVKLIKTELIK